MMTEKRLLLICLIILLLIAPITAKEITSKVDDKHIQHSYGSDYYFIHTVDFGDIQVFETEYDSVMINDTIIFKNESEFGLWQNIRVV